MKCWAAEVHRVLKSENISIVATVPDAGLTAFLTHCDADTTIDVVTLTSEQEGIGLIAGLALGGKRGMLAMQSSGVGNCMNALSLIAATRTACPMLVTMRGQWGEFNPWQVPMGKGARPCLEAMGAHCFDVDERHQVAPTFEYASKLAKHAGLATAVLISQRVLGTKSFEPDQSEC